MNRSRSGQTPPGTLPLVPADGVPEAGPWALAAPRRRLLVVAVETQHLLIGGPVRTCDATRPQRSRERGRGAAAAAAAAAAAPRPRSRPLLTAPGQPLDNLNGGAELRPATRLLHGAGTGPDTDTGPRASLPEGRAQGPISAGLPSAPPRRSQSARRFRNGPPCPFPVPPPHRAPDEPHPMVRRGARAPCWMKGERAAARGREGRSHRSAPLRAAGGTAARGDPPRGGWCTGRE